MALNDFLDKVFETSANAMDKAKDATKRLATINELKSKIRGYNNDKNKLFTQMGMDVYLAKKQNQNIDEKMDAFVSQIDTINVRIKDLKEKLALIDADESEVVAEQEEKYEIM
ncbi:MAG: hypothetical protein Q4D51_09600 [Eubacteriales bacterium]|nr:hypothetical protein [Eubacteriales bacterium]